MDCSNIPEYAPNLRTLEDAKRGEKWAAKALQNEVAILAGTLSGGRNARLHEAALSMGHKVAEGHIAEGEVIAALQGAASSNGYTQEHGIEATMATIRSGLDAGKLDPQDPVDRQDYQRRQSGTVITSEPKRESAFYSAATLKGKAAPPRQWLVDGLVPQKTVTLFLGDGGTGKSLLALQLAISAVVGTGWVGKGVTGGKVVYLSAEDDDDELHRRVDDVLRSAGHGYDDITNLTLRSLAGEDALLAIDGQLSLLQSELFKELDKLAKDENPALVVIDTLADVYPANENDRANPQPV